MAFRCTPRFRVLALSGNEHMLLYQARPPHPNLHEFKFWPATWYAASAGKSLDFLKFIYSTYEPHFDILYIHATVSTSTTTFL